MKHSGPLTPAQVNQFLIHGHVILNDCFSPEAAEEWIDDAYRQLGYDRDNPTTWEKSLAFLFPSRSCPLREFAPKAWAAVCQLVGGVERLKNPDCGIGQWVINFWHGKDEPWVPPSPQVAGWHIDGTFFRHFLDSPEQGLLVVPLFSDVGYRGGGTVFAADSVPVVARFLLQHPEGVLLNEFDFLALVAECHDFRELTGKIGDVALMHPYLLHSFSQNHSGKPRLITNVCIGLKEPMRFDLPDPAEFSLVELAILQGLRVSKLMFAPTAEREHVPAS